MDSYSESADGIMIDRRRAIEECERHHLSMDDILLMLEQVEPDADGMRDAASVLRWLGY